MCVVTAGRENEKEFRAAYVILIPASILLGLSLQAASGQEVYQVRENRKGRRPSRHQEC